MPKGILASRCGKLLSEYINMAVKNLDSAKNHGASLGIFMTKSLPFFPALSSSNNGCCSAPRKQ